jgi:hypothetical protein
MAVHLKMDFRVLELAGNLSVLQCDRGDADCVFESEFDPRLSGSLVAAIRQIRLHQCGENHLDKKVVRPSRRVIVYPSRSARQAQ